MPKFTVPSVSAVVAAQLHNPSILNHDFLLINSIIAKDWGDPTEYMSTPPFAQLAYAAKSIRFILQQERLMITKATEGEIPDIADILSTAKMYVKTLPHVKYTAVGINSTMTVEFEKGGATQTMTERFLSSVLQAPQLVPSTFSIQLRYDLQKNEQINLSYGPREGSDGSDRIECTANYHVPAETASNRIDAVIGILDAGATLMKATIDKFHSVIGI